MRVVFDVRLDHPATGNQIAEVLEGLDSVTEVKRSLIAVCDSGNFYRILGKNHVGHWIVAVGRNAHTEVELDRTYTAMSVASWNYDSGTFEVPANEGYAESLRVIRDGLQAALNIRTRSDRAKVLEVARLKETERTKVGHRKL